MPPFNQDSDLPYARVQIGDWARHGACVGEPADLFFPESGRDTWTRREHRIKEFAAKAICARCPVRTECLEYALKNREIYGIWGGTNVYERFKRLRRRNKPCASSGGSTVGTP